MTQQVQQPARNASSIAGAGGEQISRETTLFAEPVFHFKDFTITNALFTSWIAVIVIIILSFVLRSKLKEVPGKIQNLFEIIIEGALSLCDQVTNDRSSFYENFSDCYFGFLFYFSE